MVRSALILIGPTGSGKSVQAGLLCFGHPGWVHISSGDLLRQDAAATDAIGRGELVPSAEVERVISTAVREHHDAPMIIFDGFPRTIDQADWLDRLLIAEERELAKVVVFNVDTKLIHQRLAERHRADDLSTIVDAKLVVHAREVEPVVSRYYKDGVVRYVDGADDPAAIANSLEGVLNA